MKNNYAEIDFPKIQKEIHDHNVEWGFHGDNEPSEIEYRCLIIEEILEAYRAFDEGTSPVYFNVADGRIDAVNDPKEYLEFTIARNQILKPEGYAVELVDVAMRCLDYLEAKGGVYSNEWISIYQLGSNYFRHLIEISCKDTMSGSIAHKWVDLVIDSILRFFDVQEWDFLSILELKMRYNTTRPYRHGMKGVE